MNRYWVYILLCADKSYYVGMTSNLSQRIIEHNTARFPNSYTSNRLPVELVFHEEFKDPRQAREFEKRLKKWSHSKKEALINQDFRMLHLLAECKNATHYRTYGNNDVQ